MACEVADEFGGDESVAGMTKEDGAGMELGKAHKADLLFHTTSSCCRARQPQIGERRGREVEGTRQRAATPSSGGREGDGAF